MVKWQRRSEASGNAGEGNTSPSEATAVLELTTGTLPYQIESVVNGNVHILLQRSDDTFGEYVRIIMVTWLRLHKLSLARVTPLLSTTWRGP